MERKKMAHGTLELSGLGPRSDGFCFSFSGPSSELTHSPTSSGKELFSPVPFPSGSTEDVSPGGPLQPPPLPQKKLVSRAASSPDGFFWTQGSPKPRTAGPKLNLSHSETSVCVHDESHFSYSSGPGSRLQHTFSASEPLEKTFKDNGPWGPAPGLAGSQSLQGKGVSSAAASQLSMSSQASAGSAQLQLHSLLSSISSKEGTYTKLGGLYAQSLVRLVARCEDLFMGGQKKGLHFSENNWSLFKLACNKPCCDSGDAIYYCATCSEDPGSTYAVKVGIPTPPPIPQCRQPVLAGGAALWLGKSFPLSQLPKEGSFQKMLGDLTLCLTQDVVQCDLYDE